MLDILPSEVWSNPDYKWLHPATKSGVFLREAFKRLMVGLRGWQPDADLRHDPAADRIVRQPVGPSSRQPLEDMVDVGLEASVRVVDQFGWVVEVERRPKLVSVEMAQAPTAEAEPVVQDPRLLTGIPVGLKKPDDGLEVRREQPGVEAGHRRATLVDSFDELAFLADGAQV